MTDRETPASGILKPWIMLHGIFSGDGNQAGIEDYGNIKKYSIRSNFRMEKKPLTFSKDS
ncbi:MULTISPECIES: hypothetical protein [unclassified Pseudomonas]|uniref:hypothetical protein n=1 Tax=unclassified Pseudomonas TaxID=196821 RepID=UPI001B33DAE2|nr:MULTISPECIES: hypothetical protein [unclassified Pseudomonas]